MLTVRYRFNHRFRPVEADPELFISNTISVPVGELTPIRDDVSIDHRRKNAEDEILMDKIRQFE